MWLEIRDSYVVNTLPINPTGLVSPELLSNFVQVDDEIWNKLRGFSSFDGRALKYKEGEIKVSKLAKLKKAKFNRDFVLGLSSIVFKGSKLQVNPGLRDTLVAYILAELFPINLSSGTTHLEISNKEEAIALLTKILKKQNSAYNSEKLEFETPQEFDDDDDEITEPPFPPKEDEE